jgi:phosphoribosyl 1,2-cyclic phosphodiesterase
VLDAGSGIRPLGNALEAEFGDEPIRLSLLLTHPHWDHIQGLPFFSPAYDAKNEIRVLGYDGAHTSLVEILSGQMSSPFFPISFRELDGKIRVQQLDEPQFDIGPIKVRAKFLNHPGVCVGYRIQNGDTSVAFLPDNEPLDAFFDSANDYNAGDGRLNKDARAERADLVAFLKGVDLLILDTQYTDEEYAQRIGWGHGSLSSVIGLARDAEVKTLMLFHHDPNRNDADVDAMLDSARAIVARDGGGLKVEAATEGSELSLG